MIYIELASPPRLMKETPLTKSPCYRSVEALRDETSKKKALNQLHTTQSERAISNLSTNKVVETIHLDNWIMRWTTAA